MMATPNHSTTHADPLAPGQIAILAAFGAILWFLAALLMGAIEPLGAFQGSGVILLYGLVVPGTVPFVILLRKVARLRGDQTALGVTIATGAASMLDGVALVAIPSLYGANTAGAAAAILWGAGVGLILGVVMNRR
jgi:hypothetical protein